MLPKSRPEQFLFDSLESKRVGCFLGEHVVFWATKGESNRSRAEGVPSCPAAPYSAVPQCAALRRPLHSTSELGTSQLSSVICHVWYIIFLETNWSEKSFPRQTDFVLMVCLQKRRPHRVLRVNRFANTCCFSRVGLHSSFCLCCQSYLPKFCFRVPKSEMTDCLPGAPDRRCSVPSYFARRPSPS